MPLWRIFHPANFYTAEEKAAFSKAITDIYTDKSPANLPSFYVVVIFTPYGALEEINGAPPTPDSASVFVGGEPRQNFIRIVIEQIARKMEDSEVERMNWWTGMIEESIAPFIKDKAKREGLGEDIGWEIHIDQTSRDLWRINGFIPPMPNSTGEKAWREAKKAIPY